MEPSGVDSLPVVQLLFVWLAWFKGHFTSQNAIVKV